MLVDARNVFKSFDTEAGSQPVLNGVSLSLAAGETLALTGESGSGKSTLMHLLAALDSPDGGTITLDGQDITGLTDKARAEIRRTSVGLVFQQFNLIPSLTVEKNLDFQARLAGRRNPDWIATLADRLGLEPLLQRYPEQLSGGQQQRLAIGRAMAVRPKLLLADEPTGNLDEATANIVLDLMLNLVSETGAALLMVTHSTILADRLSRQLHLSQGRLA